MSSSSSDEGDARPKKRKSRPLESSSPSTSTSSGSPIVGGLARLKKRRLMVYDSESSESDGGSPILRRNPIVRIRRARRVQTDSESHGDSDSTPVRRRNGLKRRISTDLSEHQESEPSGNEDVLQNNAVDSDSSDGQAEKCPICLYQFKDQEVATPGTCDHTFCFTCLEEWSRTMNTCPVDRQEYDQIFVRRAAGGDVTRKVAINKPSPPNFEGEIGMGVEEEEEEDPTVCQICEDGSNGNVLLLCDACNFGYHTYCLDPPLTSVPQGSWYCPICCQLVNSDSEDEFYQAVLRRSRNDMMRNRTRRFTRIPRTRQNERVRRRIVRNRQQTERSAVSSSSALHRVKRTKKRATKRDVRYKIVYEIDEVTGETVAVRKRQRKTSRRSGRRRAQKNTTKSRITSCNTNNASFGSLNNSRSHAGIPTLSLFGNRNELDYFSGDEEFETGTQLLTRRAPTHSDVNAVRLARRKAMAIIPAVVTSTSDVLDSILNTQEQFHSKDSAFSIDSNGNFKISQKKIDLKKEQGTVRETPNRNHYNNRYHYNYSNNYNNRRYNNYYHNQGYQHNSFPSSSMYSNNSFQNRGGGYEENDYPQDYTQRTLCATSDVNIQGEEEEEEEKVEPQDTEIDIYSDIEAVSTSKAEVGGELKPPPTPPEFPNELNMDDDNDSESDMVIDDKVQEQAREDNLEDTIVTSTVSFPASFPFPPPSLMSIPPPPLPTNIPMSKTEEPHSSMDAESEAAQSSEIRNLTAYDDDSDDGCPNTNIYSKESVSVAHEDDESNDGCPNFSIYSRESKTVALHTDLSFPPSCSTPFPQEHQVGEVSSTPNKSPESNPKDGSDDDNVYNPEEETVLSDEPTEKTAEICQSSKPETDEELKEDDQLDAQNLEHIIESPKEDDAELAVSETNENTAEEKSQIVAENEETAEDENAKESPLPSEEDDQNLEKDEQNMEKDEDAVNLDLPSVEQEIPGLDNTPASDEKTTVPDERKTPPITSKIVIVKPIVQSSATGGLYSDSEDECVVKKMKRSFGLSDINHMTEDISEEERSYTPCLDENNQRQGLEGLDTELISDDDRNDFDESHELKTGSDGDALEINAKESELDFTRPEDYEEGEIVDKNKEMNKKESEQVNEAPSPKEKVVDDKDKKKPKKKEKSKPNEEDKNNNKENETTSTSKQSFKKLSKNNKERNYREKDKRDTSKSKEKNKERKKEKRKEIERYNVRAIIAEKPRAQIVKDKFGRDVRHSPSKSRSRSYTPPPICRSVSKGKSPPKSRNSRSRSPNRNRLSVSRHISRSPRRRSLSKSRRKRRSRRSLPRSRSKTPNNKQSKPKTKKRKRSSSNKYKKRSGDRVEKRKKKRISQNRHKSRSLSPRRVRTHSWDHREWTPLSISPQEPLHAISPSWTPPRLIDNSQMLRTEHLTVTLNNSGERRKERRRKDKRNKDTSERRRRRRQLERERTPPPSKEVFASGDNILVSVSFNNESEVRDVTTRDKRKSDEARKKKEKRKKKQRDLTGIKPVAIIDLERSPFRELTPSPKAVIILTDSENDPENERDIQQTICDSSQQVGSPERSLNYTTGPKTPPEPQVKFTLTSKTPQVRAISNPLHEPEDMETSEVHEEEVDSRMNENLHKGPNTPPEPPNSPPSSPDAYDPFEPTKSRSPTPEPTQMEQSNIDEDTENRIDTSIDLDKSVNKTPDLPKSLTPPLLDVQPADSQSSIQVTPETNQSPEKLAAPPVTPAQPVLNTSKPVAQTTPFSSVSTSINTSTPISSSSTPSRINILNSTVITPQTSIPQRIVLPNQVKSSPVKISPTKATVKLTPIKPMPTMKTNKASKKRTSLNPSSSDEVILDLLDSPYSPGSSDYEDLFEPPSDIVTKPTVKGKAAPTKHANTFDTLFGSPTFNKNKSKSEKKSFGKKSGSSNNKTKTVGVKLDEDNLKILDELPNSAVEMLVKDKFLKKLNRQERVVEEVKLVLKPHYNKKKINKDEYKDIMRRAVPKICHNKSGEINPTKIQKLIEAYIRKIKHNKKVTSSSSINPQKV